MAKANIDERMDSMRLKSAIMQYLRRRRNRLVTLHFIVKHVKTKRGQVTASRVKSMLEVLVARTLVVKTDVLSSDGYDAYRSVVIGKPRLPGLKKKQ